MPRPFLTARWEDLVFLSYRCPPELLKGLVPRGTALDRWQGAVYLSLVGFLFRDTRVLGLPIPGHREFEEVNLRFYVRREVAGEIRRGVVFIRELVPRRAVALIAKRVYNEPYLAVPMSHRISRDTGERAYRWRYHGREFELGGISSGRPEDPAGDSLAEFVTEHYWGYTRQRDGGTLEYRVDHPRWPVWSGTAHTLRGAWSELYGPALGEILEGTPESVLAADGSAVIVHSGVRLSQGA